MKRTEADQRGDDIQDHEDRECNRWTQCLAEQPDFVDNLSATDDSGFETVIMLPAFVIVALKFEKYELVLKPLFIPF